MFTMRDRECAGHEHGREAVEYAPLTPREMGLNMLSERCRTDAHPRSSNGQPAQSTTGVAMLTSRRELRRDGSPGNSRAYDQDVGLRAAHGGVSGPLNPTNFLRSSWMAS
jgi:hypothetical protein